MNTNKKFIVTTTINAPTEAIKKFSVMKDWTLIVVGDRKTPVLEYIDSDFESNGSIYLDCDIQEQLYPRLSKLLGWNTISRRNLGLLFAYQNGAEIVASVDDDNIPLPGWGENLAIEKKGSIDFYECEAIAFDPLSVTTYHHLWHRGFPVELVQEQKRNTKLSGTAIFEPLVQADLWNIDPDVDAMCRMLYKESVEFQITNLYAANRMSPFNMQNTFVARKVLKYFFSIPFIGRMDDIWCSYWLQAHFPRCVVYAPASVNHIQNRSWESIIKDLSDEILGYQHSLVLVRRLSLADPNAIFTFIPSISVEFIKLYQNYFEDV